MLFSYQPRQSLEDRERVLRLLFARMNSNSAAAANAAHTATRFDRDADDVELPSRTSSAGRYRAVSAQISTPPQSADAHSSTFLTQQSAFDTADEVEYMRGVGRGGVWRGDSSNDLMAAASRSPPSNIRNGDLATGPFQATRTIVSTEIDVDSYQSMPPSDGSRAPFE